LAREQLTRQDTDLSFSTKASWEHHGASTIGLSAADSLDATVTIAVQKEEYEYDKERRRRYQKHQV
jgi:hypothetical protein